MSLINPADLTFNGKEVQSLTECILEQALKGVLINDIHIIDNGIVAKTQIPFLGNFGTLGKKVTDCTPSSDTQTITNTEKFWDPEDVLIRIQQCYKDLDSTFFAWTRKKGLNIEDLSKTDFYDFITDRLAGKMEPTIMRIAWFADKNIAWTTDSPAGVLAPAIAKDYMNMIDGLWKQIFAICSATPARKNYTITENSAVSKLLQFTLASDRAKLAYDSLLYDADPRLKADPNKVILTTVSLYENFEKWLTSQAITPSYESLINGIKVMKLRDTLIIPVVNWDMDISTYFDNGVTLDLPHRAILTTKDQLHIGFDDSTAYKNSNFFINPVTKINYWDVAFKIDAKFMEDYMIQATY